MMRRDEMEFSDVVKFHGHVCPGLAMGYRVAVTAAEELKFDRAGDEELVAIVENNSCAVDAVQAVVGCTFGKGNLIFHDYGKQVYTFINRNRGQAVRIAVSWVPPKESSDTAELWARYRNGDRSEELLSALKSAKAAKANLILSADSRDLFTITRPDVPVPEKAQIHPTVTCSQCCEKVMEPKAKQLAEDQYLCIPCSREAE